MPQNKYFWVLYTFGDYVYNRDYTHNILERGFSIIECVFGLMKGLDRRVKVVVDLFVLVFN